MKLFYPLSKIALCLCLGLGTSLSQAEGMDNDRDMPDKAELEAALEECAASLSSDGSQSPDRSAMDECMSAKGFTRPSEPPQHGPGGMHGNPPPDHS
jgi:hypothetical protein